MSPSDEVVALTVEEVAAPVVVEEAPVVVEEAPVVVEEAPKKSKKINLSRPGVNEPNTDPRVRFRGLGLDGVTIIETY